MSAFVKSEELQLNNLEHSKSIQEPIENREPMDSVDTKTSPDMSVDQISKDISIHSHTLKKEIDDTIKQSPEQTNGKRRRSGKVIEQYEDNEEETASEDEASGKKRMVLRSHRQTQKSQYEDENDDEDDDFDDEDDTFVNKRVTRQNSVSNISIKKPTKKAHFFVNGCLCRYDSLSRDKDMIFSIEILV